MTHLIVDVRHGVPRARTHFITSRHVIEALFDDITTAIGLTRLGAIEHRYFDADHARGFVEGLTSVAILSESHISYHSCAEWDGFSMDLYSCRRDLDVDLVLEIIRSAFDIERDEVDNCMETQVIDRSFPEASISTPPPTSVSTLQSSD